MGRAGGAARSRRDALRRRAQARRSRDLAAVRRRPVHDRRDAGRRPHRRERHRERAHDRGGAQAARGQAGAGPRAEVRGEVFMPLARVRGAQPPPGCGGGAPVHEPAQRGGRAASARRTRASPRRAISRCSATRSGAVTGGPKLRTHEDDARVAARARLPGESRDPRARRSRRRSSSSASRWRRSGTRSATTSTAWS